MSKTIMGDHATTDRLTEHAHESVDRIASKAARGEERIRHEAADAEARVRDAGQKARERSDEALRTIDVFVRDRPLLSLGLAFAAGSLVSALMRRT